MTQWTEWRRAMSDALGQQSYPTMRAFLIDHPGQSYEALAEALNADVAPVHVERFSREEATASGNLQFYILDDLARCIASVMPQGWPGQGNFDANLAFGVWHGDLMPGGRASSRRLWKLLMQKATGGWKPDHGEDALLVQLWSEARVPGQE